MAGARAVRYVGWLLRVNRRLGHDRTLRSGREFARAFRCDTTRSLAPSQITRWENGELAPSRATIRRYEHLLGLPAESLVTINDAVARAEDAEVPRPEPRTASDDGRDRLFDLLDRATARHAMTGPTWSELTELIAARPQLELYPPKLWRDIAERLLGELVVAVDGAWLQRQEAMCRLLEHPAARRHAIAACISLTADPGAPAVLEPLTLLDVTAHPDANRYVLAQLACPDSDRAMHGALMATVRKARDGHFRDGEWPGLVRCIRSFMTDPLLNQTLLPMVVDIGRAIARQLPGDSTVRRSLPSTSLARHVWAARRTSDPEIARDVGRRVAALAQTQVSDDSAGTDDTLAALVEECLFDANPDRRMIASMLIAATPYRVPVATVIHARLITDVARRGNIYPAAALRTLTQLGVDIHRPLIHDILVRPGSAGAMRYAAAWATPHCAGRHPAPAWRSILATQLDAWRRNPSGLSESILQGIAYGIGTDGHRDLLTRIREDPDLPSSARTIASWLLDTELTRE